MKKHAYCIIAHHNWWQLQILLELLDDKRNDIFIHIDKKVNNIDRESIKSICKKSSVKIYQDVDVQWGGVSQVRCELSIFEHAYCESLSLEQGGYDYYHLLSGVDLPLKTQDEIHGFFDEHSEYNFIRYDDDYASSENCIGRVRYYFFAHDLKIKNAKRKRAVIYIDKCIRMIQRLIRVNRMRHFPYKLYFGSNWVSIKQEAVKILLDNRDNIYKCFRYTLCPDELYKHTILRNSGVKTYSFDKDHVVSCLRYIDFSNHLPNPKTITMNDFDTVMNSGALFARKFDETVDKEVIKRIYSTIMKSAKAD